MVPQPRAAESPRRRPGLHTRKAGTLNERDEAAQKIEALREPDATLVAAILRIGASLDLDTVLREVVDGARALTGARYGAITTVDRDGQPRDFVTAGVTPEEHRAMETWPDRLRLFGHLRELAAPLRLPDLDAWVRSLGCSPLPVPCGTFQATPMRHRGAAAGSFFLGGKESGFTDADEEMLVLFAQQAAAALANARAHREEQRARADLEALVETCPVGVVVFDGGSGRLVSFNREARRIVEPLRMPGGALEELLDVVTCRRGDGREVPLAEFPMAQQLSSAETVRAEEITLSVPDGRSVTTLVDATPIRSTDGVVESMVVTLQDLAPFEALERSRAEFLGMVSHELRTPLAAIKGSAATALEDGRDPDRAELRQFLRIIEEQAGRMSSLIGDLLDAGRLGAGLLPVEPAPEDLAGLVERARTAFAGAGGRHGIVIDLPADLPPVLADRRRVVQVLDNLLANAARHSPDVAPIRVAAQRDGAQVEVSVTDAGEGVPTERLPHLFRRHAGGDAGVGGGSGLGLVICRGLVEAHGGRIRAESGGASRGTRIAFTLPAAAEEEGRAPAAPSSPLGRAREKTSVLVVDDDPHARRQTRDVLAAAGYAPAATGEPGQVARLIEATRPALVLLDLVLPGADGIELLRTLPGLADLPVIFVSAYGGGETVARALEAGAADYLVKPFSPAELVARVGLALRRRTPPAPFVLGELAIDRAKRRVTVAGRPVRLTATEYRLLHALSLDAGGATTYEALQRRVWGGRGRGNPQAVRSAVRKLRRKLSDDIGRPKYILTERGLGYRMPRPDEP